MEDQTEADVELLGGGLPTPTVTGSVQRGRSPAPLVVAMLAIAIALTVGWLQASDESGSSPLPSEPDRAEQAAANPAADSSSDTDLVTSSTPEIPLPLAAAEAFVTHPNARTLRNLIDAIGGLEAITLGEAEGAFDLVRFDPLDHNRLLASARSSYGDAQNQGTNEQWLIDQDGIAQTLWAPDTVHDFVHFNVDGTITMWVPTDDATGYAPRSAVLLDNDGTSISSTRSVHASRFTATAGSIFALTGNGDYYSINQTYELLIADGLGRQLLDSGETYEWIDNPIPELLVAYPRDANGSTTVWDPRTMERLDEHPIAGRSYQRVAVSSDGERAVGITFDGQLEPIDLLTGETTHPFGSVVATGIDQPITLNRDGTIAITVERSGLVAVWWVGDSTPIATVQADAAQPRWVSEQFGARSASAVAIDGSRVALRRPARPQIPVSWLVVDTSVDGWIQHACDLAGRPLSKQEREALGLPPSPSACN